MMFLIPCVIGTMSFERSMCDLEACVSLMPLLICRKLDLVEIKSMNISLQLADWSIKYLVETLKDVSIRIQQLLIPTNFVIIEIEEESQIHVLLERPFLTTDEAIIKVKHVNLSSN